MKLVLLLITCTIAATLHAQTWSCGPTRHASDTALSRTTLAGPGRAGFDLGTSPEQIDHSACSSSKSFFFSAPAPEGNYVVTVDFGGPEDAVTTVKAESRRLMLLNVRTRAGQHRSESFIVNVRRPEITGNGAVRLKPREIGALDWDDKLTLEFSGERPSIRSIHIAPAPAGTPTVYLAGDSTVVDQDKEPWAAWGQMLPVFFDSRIAIANHAESGETIGSFESEQRFAKIFSVIQAGDYLFMQFAHNDQKPGRGYVSPERYDELLRKYIARAREKRVTPVLVTSMNRRTFDASGKVTDTLAPYPALMRSVAAQEHVALIDLNHMSATLYEAIGEAHSKELFVYAAPNTYPDQPEALHDDTHFNNYGAYELARCVVLGIQQSRLPLAKRLRKPVLPFDPSHPDAAQSLAIPPSPFVEEQKPYER
jgi:lysophospholipase L1-like esterase